MSSNSGGSLVTEKDITNGRPFSIIFRPVKFMVQFMVLQTSHKIWRGYHAT